jgi:5'(3')-deoxyribonucleotidase
MKTLMIDMDNVITDSRFLDLINEFLGTNYEWNDFKTYYLQEIIGDKKEEFWNYVKDRNFYEGATLFEGCYDVLRKLNDKYDLYIVTAYLWNDVIDISGDNLRNKYYYLKEMLPFINSNKYIFTTNKNLLKFDIRIDDRLDNIMEADTKILFTAWHNRDLDDKFLEDNNVIRVNSWDDIEKLLLK